MDIKLYRQLKSPKRKGTIKFITIRNAIKKILKNRIQNEDITNEAQLSRNP